MEGVRPPPIFNQRKTQMKNVNKISDKLMEIVKAAMPKHGQRITFEALKPTRTSTRILNYDRILDPYANNGEGAYVDIAYIKAERPNMDPDSNRETIVDYGEIVFFKDSIGRISITGGRADMEKQFMFLFLTNQNITNADKPWHIRPQGGNYSFKMVEPAKTAKELLAFDRKVDEAKRAIDEMGSKELFQHAKIFNLPDVQPEYTDPDEVRLKLREIAKKHPDKILNVTRDVDKQLELKVLAWLEAGLIEKKSNKWYVVGSDNALCTRSGVNSYESAMIEYLQTKEGIETEKILDEQLKSASA